MTISLPQIRAARALLDWRQQDLAKKSGISLPAITKLERQLVSPRQSTLDVLQKTFELEGIEFTDGPGVRLTDGLFALQTFSGKDAPTRLLDDIFQTLRARNVQEVILSGLDENQWRDYAADIVLQQQRFIANGISWRALLREGDTNFLAGVDPSRHYRWISKELFTQLPHYVYADKFAFVLWGRPIRATIIQNRLVAETFRKQFDMNWKNGRLPKR
jgi:transcriptional regulator with XRE-family HTH domain